ncbi:MAG TPA: tyrosine-protein phosphatase [Pyrinomonadaceae bacterium]|jgi:protein tyrosine/serine phosphatase
MKLIPDTLRPAFATLLTILALSVISLAQTPRQVVPFNIKIKNFGQMDERFYRGAQPKTGDYQDLAQLGIKTVIDLRDNPTDYEKPAVEALGMHYVNIPMSDKDYPREEQIAAFLKLVNNPETGKFYVHCAGGRHRTGVMGAVYRFNLYHWNYDQVYKEMKDYDFYTRWGHGDMKKYVEDYWQRIQAGQVTPTADATHATATR